MWICECGKKNNEDDKHCRKCFKDLYGFTEKERSPQSVAELLMQKANILKEAVWSY